MAEFGRDLPQKEKDSSSNGTDKGKSSVVKKNGSECILSSFVPEEELEEESLEKRRDVNESGFCEEETMLEAFQSFVRENCFMVDDEYQADTAEKAMENDKLKEFAQFFQPFCFVLPRSSKIDEFYKIWPVFDKYPPSPTMVQHVENMKNEYQSMKREVRKGLRLFQKRIRQRLAKFGIYVEAVEKAYQEKLKLQESISSKMKLNQIQFRDQFHRSPFWIFFQDERHKVPLSTIFSYISTRQLVQTFFLVNSYFLSFIQSEVFLSLSVTSSFFNSNKLCLINPSYRFSHLKYEFSRNELSISGYLSLLAFIEKHRTSLRSIDLQHITEDIRERFLSNSKKENPLQDYYMNGSIVGLVCSDKIENLEHLHLSIELEISSLGRTKKNVILGEVGRNDNLTEEAGDAFYGFHFGLPEEEKKEKEKIVKQEKIVYYPKTLKRLEMDVKNVCKRKRLMVLFLQWCKDKEVKLEELELYGHYEIADSYAKRSERRNNHMQSFDFSTSEDFGISSWKNKLEILYEGITELKTIKKLKIFALEDCWGFTDSFMDFVTSSEGKRKRMVWIKRICARDYEREPVSFSKSEESRSIKLKKLLQLYYRKKKEKRRCSELTIEVLLGRVVDYVPVSKMKSEDDIQRTDQKVYFNWNRSFEQPEEEETADGRVFRTFDFHEDDLNELSLFGKRKSEKQEEEEEEEEESLTLRINFDERKDFDYHYKLSMNNTRKKPESSSRPKIFNSEFSFNGTVEFVNLTSHTMYFVRNALNYSSIRSLKTFLFTNPDPDSSQYTKIRKSQQLSSSNPEDRFLKHQSTAIYNSIWQLLKLLQQQSNSNSTSNIQSLHIYCPSKKLQQEEKISVFQTMFNSLHLFINSKTKILSIQEICPTQFFKKHQKSRKKIREQLNQYNFSRNKNNFTFPFEESSSKFDFPSPKTFILLKEKMKKKMTKKLNIQKNRSDNFFTSLSIFDYSWTSSTSSKKTCYHILPHHLKLIILRHYKSWIAGRFFLKDSAEEGTRMYSYLTRSFVSISQYIKLLYGYFTNDFTRKPFLLIGAVVYRFNGEKAQWIPGKGLLQLYLLDGIFTNFENIPDNLESLALSKITVERRGFVALLNRLRNLRKIAVQGVTTLAHLEVMKVIGERMEIVRMMECGMSAEGLQELLESKTIKSLMVHEDTHSWVDDLLGRPEVLSALRVNRVMRRISFDMIPVGDAGLRRLKGNEWLTSASFCEIGMNFEGLVSLLIHPKIRLIEADVMEGKKTEEGSESRRKREYFLKNISGKELENCLSVERLDLSHAKNFGDYVPNWKCVGTKKIPANFICFVTKYCGRITTLSINSWNSINDEIFIQLLKLPLLKKLEANGLGNMLTNASISSICQHKTLSILDFRGTYVDQHGLALFFDSKGLEELDLDLSFPDFTSFERCYGNPLRKLEKNRSLKVMGIQGYISCGFVNYDRIVEFIKKRCWGVKILNYFTKKSGTVCWNRDDDE